MLKRALDIVNKWPQDIGDQWRKNLVKDVVSVVVTVVIVNTVKPLPLNLSLPKDKKTPSCKFSVKKSSIKNLVEKSQNFVGAE